MKRHRLLLIVPAALVLAFSSSGCQSMQMKQCVNRLDKLEARVNLLESQVQALQKK